MQLEGVTTTVVESALGQQVRLWVLLAPRAPGVGPKKPSGRGGQVPCPRCLTARNWQVQASTPGPLAPELEVLTSRLSGGVSEALIPVGEKRHLPSALPMLNAKGSPFCAYSHALGLPWCWFVFSSRNTKASGTYPDPHHQAWKSQETHPGFMGTRFSSCVLAKSWAFPA